MEELLKCDTKTYQEKIEEISDESQLRELLSELTEALQDVKSKISELGNIQLKELENNPELKGLIVKRNELSNKILTARGRLKNLGKSEENLTWALLQRKQPQNIFKQGFRYNSSNQKRAVSITLSDCGAFIYSDKTGLSIEELYSECKENMLNLIKVEAQDIENDSLLSKYYVLMSLDEKINYFLPEAQDILENVAKELFSKSYMDKALMAVKDGKCPYGGKIYALKDDKINFDFNDSKQEQLVEKANTTCGKFRNMTGEKEGSLMDFIKEINASLQNGTNDGLDGEDR